MLLKAGTRTLQFLDPQYLPAEVLRRYPKLSLDDPFPLTETARTGNPIWIETFDEYITRYPNMEDVLRNITGSQASATVPLIVDGRRIGAMGISFPHSRQFSQADRRFLLTLADHCAQALERARLYDAEHAARMEAEAANALKLRFLAIISHELRTPLTSIKGFTSTLLAEDVRFSEEDQRKFLSIIEAEADRLYALIVQLLNMSQIQAGALQIERVPCTLGELMAMARPQLEALSVHHALKIDIDAQDTLLFIDAARIVQVLSNLVQNATKYAPPGTAITASARRVDHAITFSVRDDGPGILPADRQRIFEPFHQLKGGKQGVGLGLAICKGLVEAHGGRIWVEETASPGALISFALPTDL